MHRIDGPGATVDNKFTEGDPVGGIQATVVTAPWLNDVQEEILSVLAAGSVTPAKGTQDQLLQASYRLAQNQKASAFTTGGTATTLTLSPTPAIPGYAPWQRFNVKFNVPSGLNPTINVSGKGAKSLKQYDSSGAKVSASFAADQIGDIVYDGTDFVLLNPLSTFAPQSGLVGGSRNLLMSVTAASATATITADEVIVEAGAFGALQYRLSSFSKLINLATTGAGGMDTGGAPVNGFVGIYAIYNPSLPLSGTNPALLAQNATSGALGNVYGGANMPAGYTASALLSVWPTDAARLLKTGFQMDREIYIPATNALSNGTATAYSPVSISGVVPPNAKTCSGHLAPQGTSGSTAWLAGSASGIGEKSAGGNTAVARPPVSAYSGLPLITAQTVFYYQLASTGVSVVISGYTF